MFTPRCEDFLIHTIKFVYSCQFWHKSQWINKKKTKTTTKKHHVLVVPAAISCFNWSIGCMLWCCGGGGGDDSASALISRIIHAGRGLTDAREACNGGAPTAALTRSFRCWISANRSLLNLTPSSIIKFVARCHESIEWFDNACLIAWSSFAFH